MRGIFHSNTILGDIIVSSAIFKIQSTSMYAYSIQYLTIYISHVGIYSPTYVNRCCIQALYILGKA